MGINTHPSLGDMKKEELPMALLNSQQTKLHRSMHRESNKSRNSNNNTLIALPNDRFASVRPGIRDDAYL